MSAVEGSGGESPLDPGTRAILDELPAAAVLLDERGGIIHANPQAEAKLHQPREWLIGKDLFSDVLSDLPAGLTERYRARVGEPGFSLHAEAKLTGPRAQQHLRLEIRGLPDSAVGHSLVVLEDRTALARAEERIQRLERLAAVGEFTESAAHEINNPLASIRSFAQLLVGEVTSAEQRQALQMIVRESGRIAQIIDNVVNYAHQQGVSGREPLNLTRLAEQILELREQALSAAGIEVRPDLDPSLSPVVGEASGLHQVILNLVLHAEDALAHKKGDRLLIIRTRETSEGVVVSVFDNGPGIPRDVLPHIFDSLQASKLHGIGVRLALAASIVREHGGQIVAESDERRGTAFFVRLPRAPTATEEKPPAATTDTAASTRSLRVLVADDEATLRLAIALFLQRRGHHVVQAADAHEALRLAQGEEFDAAMVDVRMPGDGLALMEKLDDMPGLRGRTILMTGDLAYARVNKGLREGRPYLIKPFDMHAAVELVEALAR